jgi:tRNA-splicing ligase RtcB (3'-phosphate/5'-hydroxy nucleic acid ligase)
MPSDPRLSRLDPTRLEVVNDLGIAATLFAGEQVPVESAAVSELLDLLQLQKTVERVADKSPSSFDRPPEIDRVAVTPDFHKAAGIPVGTVLATRGFVVPAAIGNDVNCGMRVHVTNLQADALKDHLDDLETAARRIYFEGGRNIPMTRAQRQAMFMNGLLCVCRTKSAAPCRTKNAAPGSGYQTPCPADNGVTVTSWQSSCWPHDACAAAALRRRRASLSR